MDDISRDVELEVESYVKLSKEHLESSLILLNAQNIEVQYLVLTMQGFL